MIVQGMKNGTARMRPENPGEQDLLHRAMSHGGFSLVTLMQDHEGPYLQFDCTNPVDFNAWDNHRPSLVNETAGVADV